MVDFYVCHMRLMKYCLARTENHMAWSVIMRQVLVGFPILIHYPKWELSL